MLLERWMGVARVARLSSARSPQVFHVRRDYLAVKGIKKGQNNATTSRKESFGTGWGRLLVNR